MDKVFTLILQFIASLEKAGYPVRVTNMHEAGHLEAAIILPEHVWRKGDLVRKDK